MKLARAIVFIMALSPCALLPMSRETRLNACRGISYLIGIEIDIFTYKIDLVLHTLTQGSRPRLETMDFLHEEKKILLVLYPPNAILLACGRFLSPGDPRSLLMNNALCCMFGYLQYFVHMRYMACNVMQVRKIKYNRRFSIASLRHSHLAFVTFGIVSATDLFYASYEMSY